MERFRRFSARLLAGVGLGLLVFPLVGRAAEPDAKLVKAREQAIAKAIGFLETKGQDADGAYSAAATGPAVTALVTRAILEHGRTVDDPQVKKGLAYLKTYVQEDGGIYKPDSALKNYETCLSIQCFVAANKDGRYDALLERAEAFIKDLQWGPEDGKEYDASNPSYGGAGYGRHERPDLSNTQMLLDALKATGNGPEDEAVQRALIFVSRCQNLETEHNTTEFSAKNPDGGFYYTPAAGGSSQAGPTPEGGLRSYGSMTYAGLKSMIYAGVGPDDSRVKAAIEWLSKHYSLEENPGMGSSGLYYYYHTFAKALDAVGQETFVDDAGVEHRWRDELSAELIRRQRPDGSWANDDERWLEGDPNLVTGYALLALSYCVEKD